MATRYIVAALAVIVFSATASAQIVVPTDWKRLNRDTDSRAEAAACARQGGGALFRAVFEGRRLAATVMKAPEVPRDPVPYDLDWAAALSPQPIPPGDRGQATAWAVAYARDHAARIVVPVEDGYLIGFGAGEYGGSLWWYPKQPGSGRKLAAASVRAIVATPEPGTYIVLSGLAHMGIDTGAAVWVDRGEPGQWQVRSSVALPGSPYLHAVRPEGILVANLSRVDFLDWTGEVQTIHSSMVEAFPSSLAFGPAGEIAIGRSVLVSVLTPLGGGRYREDSFQPKECQTFVYSRGRICMCAGAPLFPEP